MAPYDWPSASGALCPRNRRKRHRHFHERQWREHFADTIAGWRRRAPHRGLFVAFIRDNEQVGSLSPRFKRSPLRGIFAVDSRAAGRKSDPAKDEGSRHKRSFWGSIRRWLRKRSSFSTLINRWGFQLYLPKGFHSPLGVNGVPSLPSSCQKVSTSGRKARG